MFPCSYGRPPSRAIPMTCGARTRAAAGVVTLKTARSPSPEPASAEGLLYAVAAYLMWGLMPLYWKALRAVPAVEVLAHRVVWSGVIAGVAVAARGGMGEVGRALRTPALRWRTVAAGVLVTANWGLYIWAVNAGYVLETSLGYFMMPVVNAALGVTFLGERLRRGQIVALGLASAGILYAALGVGRFPWIACLLAATFGTYGLLRKTARVATLPALLLETLSVLPVALAYLVWRGGGAAAAPSTSVTELALLVGAGLVTLLPLVCFAEAAVRLRLSTLGMMQYIGPSVQFALAVTVFDEPFTRANAITFAAVWSALALFATDAWWGRRAHRRGEASARPPRSEGRRG
jgi:chloramphenicol-sensitive protein RarD